MCTLAYLNTYQSKNTRESYLLAIRRFLESVYKRPLELGQVEQAAARYLSEKRDFEKDLTDFLADMNGSPPKTVRLRLSGVRVFLSENDIELPAKFWRRLNSRIKGSRALTLDKVPSNAQLKQVLQHMPVHGRALYLMLSSSGMRIGEALQLRLNDIEKLSSGIGLASIRGSYSKSGNSRYAFYSTEAQEAIEEWLKVRDKYLQAASGKSHKYAKAPNDDRLFPFEDNTAYSLWRNALEKAGYYDKDRSTKRLKIHPHVLRKFFRTRLGAVLPVDIVEALMGHEGYLTEVYRKYGQDELAEYYLKGMHALLVFTNGGPSPEQVQKLVNEKVEDKIGALQKVIANQAQENLELRAKVAKIELTLIEMQKTINKILEER